MGSPLEQVQWPVRTARLTLRPAVLADLEATWRFRRLEEVSRWTTARSSTREEYAERFRDPDRLGKTLVVELDGVIVGDLMLAVEDGWSQAEIADRAVGVQAELGWTLDPAHGGRGLATEAVEALVRLCLEDLGLRRVTATCFADNEESWRLMDRVGMRQETHARGEALHRCGQWLDSFGYALLAEEWRQRAGPGLPTTAGPGPAERP